MWMLPLAGSLLLSLMHTPVGRSGKLALYKIFFPVSAYEG